MSNFLGKGVVPIKGWTEFVPVEEAPFIYCECGCGNKLKSLDKYARPVRFINGHNERKYETIDTPKKDASKRYREKNPDAMRIAKKKYYRKRKLLAMELKGNECHFCGLEYDGTNAPVFEFHHTEPDKKEHGITRMLINKAWKDTLKELDICVLTCANCHNRFHGGEW